MHSMNPQNSRFPNSSYLKLNLSNRSVSINPSLPLILSVFISQDMFSDRELPLTPASSLTIPLINIRTPFNYIFVFIIDIITIFLGKNSAVLSSQNSCLPLEFRQGYPDLYALRQIYRQPLPSLSTAERSSSQNGTIPGTPLFPQGLAFNILLSAPLEESETASTFYALRLFTIRHLYGVLVAVITIFVYLFLYPRVRTKATGPLNNFFKNWYSISKSHLRSRKVKEQNVR